VVSVGVGRTERLGDPETEGDLETVFDADSEADPLSVFIGLTLAFPLSEALIVGLSVFSTEPVEESDEHGVVERERVGEPLEL
jgi:hypothetical protein